MLNYSLTLSKEMKEELEALQEEARIIADIMDNISGWDRVTSHNFVEYEKQRDWKREGTPLTDENADVFFARKYIKDVSKAYMLHGSKMTCENAMKSIEYVLVG